jgi:hypothetical protein
MLAIPDDLASVTRYLELLHHDREFLHRLKYNALETAKGWPSWEQASRFLAVILEKIASKPAAPHSEAALMIPALLQKGVDLANTPQYSTRVSATDSDGFHDSEARAMDYGTELAELRKFRDVILSSGSYRLARKISSFRQSGPVSFLRRIVPGRIKHALKSRLTG